MNDKTHWRKAFKSDFLSSCDIEGNDLILTIDKVILQKVKAQGGQESDCNVAYFKEDVKPMILNVGNSKRVLSFAKSKYIEDWSGIRIQVYVQSNVRFGSELTEGLRIRPHQPKGPNGENPEKNKLPELRPGHSKWDGAKNAIKNGTQDIESIRKYFKVSPENEKLLLQ